MKRFILPLAALAALLVCCLSTRVLAAQPMVMTDAAVSPEGVDSSPVSINEVMFAPIGGDFEWVELKNRSTSPAHLSGYVLTDEDGNAYRIPAMLPEVPGGGFVVVIFDGHGGAGDDLDFSDNVATLHAGPGLVDIFEDGADQVALYAKSSYIYLPVVLARSVGSVLNSTQAIQVAADIPAGSDIVSFVAWGADPAPDDANAVKAGLWGEGLYKDLREIGDQTLLPVFPGRPLGLLPGRDPRNTGNWVHYLAMEETPGSENPVPVIQGHDPVAGATIDSATFAIGWPWVEGATAYHFQMDNNADMASPEYDVILPGPAFVPSGPVPEGRYYWRVAVIQEGLTGPWLAPTEVSSAAPPAASRNTGADLADFTRVLGVRWQLQRKDTKMVCLSGDNENAGVGNEQTKGAPWDAPHPDTGTVKEHGAYYCERATISMLASYYGQAYGKHLSQDRIAYEDYKGEVRDQLGHTKNGNNTFIDDQLVWAKIKVSAKIFRKPDFSEVKSWIDEGHPMIMLGNDHFRVVDGYREYQKNGQTIQELHFLDPLKRANDPQHPEEYGLWRSLTYEPIVGVWVGPAWPWGQPDVLSDEPEIDMDSDFDGLVDFDEVKRFRTDPTSPDTDGDGVPDKLDMRDYVFDAAGVYSSRKADYDGTGGAKELDPDNDRARNDGSPDGCEDANHNGKLDAGETSNFDSAHELPCATPCRAFPVLTAPANGGTIRTLLPALEWSISEPANVVKYHLEVSTDSSFNHIVQRYDVTISNSGVDVAPGWQSGEQLFKYLPTTPSTFFWRASFDCRYDKSKSPLRGPYSAVWSFNTLVPYPMPVPSAPMPLSPANGSTVTGPTVTLKWTPVGGARWYQDHFGPVGADWYMSCFTPNAEISYTGLTGNTTYEWWVYALGDFAAGPASTRFTFTTTPSSGNPSGGENVRAEGCSCELRSR